jgi:uroporphyrinogen-III synthase
VAGPVADAATPGFDGRRVLAFESRRATEIDALIRSYGGAPIVAPAIREMPLESNAEVLDFADRLERAELDAVVFLTGVGVRAIVEIVSLSRPREQFLDALRRTRVIVRGPKPRAVMRELDVAVWANAPEPNTWRELIAAIDARAADWPLAGARVAVQEYGVSNVDLLEALRARGADVTAVQAYQWAMPDDLSPLEAAARAVARGDVDVILVTSGIQFEHFWRVVGALGLDADVRRRIGGMVIGSIGPSASAEIRRHGCTPAFEPAHPKMGLLVREAAISGERASRGSSGR